MLFEISVVIFLTLSLIIQSTQLLITISLFREEEIPPMTEESKMMYS